MASTATYSSDLLLLGAKSDTHIAGDSEGFRRRLGYEIWMERILPAWPVHWLRDDVRNSLPQHTEPERNPPFPTFVLSYTNDQDEIADKPAATAVQPESKRWIIHRFIKFDCLGKQTRDRAK